MLWEEDDLDIILRASDEGGARLSGVRTRILRRDGDGEEGCADWDPERGGVVGVDIEVEGMIVEEDLTHSSSLSVTKIKGWEGRSRGMVRVMRSNSVVLFIRSEIAGSSWLSCSILSIAVYQF